MRVFFIVVLLNVAVAAQQQFKFTTISKKYDVEVTSDKFESSAGRGRTKVDLFRKGGKRPFQIIRLKDTYIDTDENGKPETASVKD
jgi:hypothetical protein